MVNNSGIQHMKNGTLYYYLHWTMALNNSMDPTFCLKHLVKANMVCVWVWLLIMIYPKSRLSHDW